MNKTLETILIKIGLKESPKKRVKKALSEDEKIMMMSEEERIAYYYELSLKQGNKTAFQMALDKEEERQGSYLIHFEFLPKRQNFINCRSLIAYMEKQAGVKNRLWKNVRDNVEENAGAQCVICGQYDEKESTKTEAHEVWKFETTVLKKDTLLINGSKRYKLKAGRKIYIQRLVRIEALDKFCHGVKHFNRWFAHPEMTDILKQTFMVMNDASEEQFERDLESAYEKQKVLERTYLLDCSALLHLGLKSEIVEQVKELEIDVLFNPHSEEFQKFLNIEFLSKEEQDNG